MAQNKQQAQWACVKEAQFYAQDVALSSDAPVIGTRCRSGQLFVLARISHQDHGSRRRIRVRKRRSGAKSVAIATV